MSNLEPSGEYEGGLALEESPEELLQKCADMDDTEAWDRFLARFNPLIIATVVRTIRRYGFDRAGLRDDLVQDVYLKFSANRAKVLREFKPLYPGAVFGYLRVIAANVVHDHFKSKMGKYSDQSPLPDNVAAPDETEWRLLLRDIDDLLKKPPVSARDRQIFWLYYRQGMSAKEIAAISSLNLTIKGVESVIVRLNQLIRNAFENGERQ
ncbi:MAG TPA: sigma-70 family RNA polymerase sigma factor [Bryobacteraceae bacterium]|nr:sigma-70 family RNA polymerase sigma factor [Bryobacteraceae bacterium]